MKLSAEESSNCITLEVKVILLQRKSRKKSEAFTGFEPMTIPVQCSTKLAMKSHGKQVRSSSIYTRYMKRVR